MRQKYVVLAGAALLAALWSCVASATLGEEESSISAEPQLANASIKQTELGSYRVHEILQPSGTVIREYAGPDGKVFAVTWHGPFSPNLRQTLGSYFDQYAAAGPAGRQDRNHVQVQREQPRRASGRPHAGLQRPRLPAPGTAERCDCRRSQMTVFFRRVLRGGFAVALCVSAASCGGGDSTISPGGGPVSPANNVVDVAVTPGPTNNSINVLYTTVTVCLPGTSNCQTIDNIQVDTGSYGLRILAPVLTLTFPVATLSNGSALVECTSFVDGYSWGPVTMADVQISGEKASSVPVQIIGDTRYPSVPTDCMDSTHAECRGHRREFRRQRASSASAPSPRTAATSAPPSVTEPIIYYACTTESNCTGTAVPLACQVPNPVTVFATDNNGSIITLPSVATAGAATASGSLIFGIDTESNNASGTETVVPIAASGYLTAIFNGGSPLTESFIDSGSNANFFSDSSIATCTQSGFSDFYCPASTTSLSGELQLASGTSTVGFEVGNAEQIDASFYAYPGLGGTNPNPNSFDWGLPFFYGRRVAVAIQGYTTSAGTGPYIAY